MKWVDAGLSSRTKFEAFLMEKFGIYADLSASEQLTIAVLAAMAVPTLLVYWSRSTSL